MSDNLLTYAFGFFLYMSIHLVAIWGLFWMLRKLVAPFVRDILKGIRI